MSMTQPGRSAGADASGAIPPRSPSSLGEAPLRVLFLDVDGVVCCNDQGILERDKMGHLARIVRETGSKVCLSTNWRLYDDLRAQLVAELATLNIECIGTTPDAGAAGCARQRGHHASLRRRNRPRSPRGCPGTGCPRPPAPAAPRA